MTLQHNCHIRGHDTRANARDLPDVQVHPETAQHDVALFIVPGMPNVSLSLGNRALRFLAARSGGDRSSH
jgi:hypothetical protein